MAVTQQQLNQFLNQHFSLGELRTLCFELNIPYDDLEGGEARAAKTLELVKYAQRHGLFETLVSHAQAQRPFAKISAVTGSSAGSVAATTAASQAEPKPAEARTEYHFHGQVVGAAIGGSTVNAQNIAGRDIIIGQEPKSREEFAEQLKQLQALLQEAIANGEITNARDAKDAAEEVQDAVDEVQSENPDPDRIARKLDGATKILNKAGEAATAAGKVGTIVLKAVPILAGLVKVVQTLF